MKTVLLRILLLVFCIVSMMACHARTPGESSAIPADPAKLKEITLVFRQFTVNPGIQNGEPLLERSKISASEYLKAKSLFKAVEDDDGNLYDPPVLFVDVQLTALKMVQTKGRILLGPFMGRSYMRMLVTILDQSGNPISQKELVGAPNAMGSAFSFGGSDRSLPHHMGMLLADYLIAEASKVE
jgi:hypothetical protein